MQHQLFQPNFSNWIFFFYIQIKTNGRQWNNSRVFCNNTLFKYSKYHVLKLPENILQTKFYMKLDRNLKNPYFCIANLSYNILQYKHPCVQYLRKMFSEYWFKPHRHKTQMNWGRKTPAKDRNHLLHCLEDLLSTRKRKSSIKKIKKDSVFWAAQFVVCLPRG